MREGGRKGGGRLASGTSLVEAPGGRAAGTKADMGFKGTMPPPGMNREVQDECVSEVDCGRYNIPIPMSVPESHQRGFCDEGNESNTPPLLTS